MPSTFQVPTSAKRTSKRILLPFFRHGGPGSMTRQEESLSGQREQAQAHRVELSRVQCKRVCPAQGPGEQRVPHEAHVMSVLADPVAETARGVTRCQQTLHGQG